MQLRKDQDAGRLDTKFSALDARNTHRIVYHWEDQTFVNYQTSFEVAKVIADKRLLLPKNGETALLKVEIQQRIKNDRWKTVWKRHGIQSTTVAAIEDGAAPKSPWRIQGPI